MYWSELVIKKLGVDLAAKCKEQFAGVVHEGHPDGEVKAIAPDLAETLKFLSTQDAKAALKGFGALPKDSRPIEEGKPAAPAQADLLDYWRRSAKELKDLASKAPPKSLQLDAFGTIALHLTQLADGLEKEKEADLVVLSKDIFYSLRSGLQGLLQEKIKIVGAEADDNSHTILVSLLLDPSWGTSVLPGGVSLRPLVTSKLIQEGRNQKHVEAAAKFANKAGAKVVMVALGGSDAHDLTTAVKKYNDAHKDAPIALLRVEPEWMEGVKKLLEG